MVIFNYRDGVFYKIKINKFSGLIPDKNKKVKSVSKRLGIDLIFPWLGVKTWLRVFFWLFSIRKLALDGRIDINLISYWKYLDFTLLQLVILNYRDGVIHNEGWNY